MQIYNNNINRSTKYTYRYQYDLNDMIFRTESIFTLSTRVGMHE